MSYDVVVVGGGPCGATAAEDLAKAGRRVALLDRDGPAKPCGGAIPPRLIADFAIPETQLVARITTARLISPSGRSVDVALEDGFVGMVDRAHFDGFLRARAGLAGAERVTGSFLKVERGAEGAVVLCRDRASGAVRRLPTRLVVGADGARSQVARQEVPADAIPHLVAYHEVIRRPALSRGHDPSRCVLVHDGRISPDYYGWIFPHGETCSVGAATGIEGFDLALATDALRRASGLAGCETLGRASAALPLQPRPRWDNGRDVLLAGDAAGTAAPATGEGLYYAMAAGRVAAEAALSALVTGHPRDLGLARRAFMKEHAGAFRALGAARDAYYRSDERRERLVSLCHDRDLQRLTFEAYMTKRQVARRPIARLRIGLKSFAHLTRLVPETYA